jgi:hypothetical protein
MGEMINANKIFDGKPEGRSSISLPDHCSAVTVLTLKWRFSSKKTQCCLWFHVSKSVTAVQGRFRTTFGEEGSYTLV